MAGGPHREGEEPKPKTHGLEKSDLAVVAMKPANNAEPPAAEWVEPRTGTEGNADQPRTQRTQSRGSVSQGLERVRQAARQRKKQGKPQRFNFLGFTFIRGRSRRAAFLLRRHTRCDRLREALREIKGEMRRRRHDSLADQSRWLRSVVTGYFA